MTIVLHELALDRGILSSPYCWMVRFALAHKGLDYRALPTAFTGIPSICGGGQKMVPVLEDGGKIVADSWAIAEHLEAAYPDRPSLFAGALGRNYARFILVTCTTHVVRAGIKVVVGEVFKKLQPQDRDYYRESRSQRLGMSIEEFTAAPAAERIAALRAALEPLRAVVKDQPFLSGAAPLYADYVGAGFFMWWRAASPERVFDKDDPLMPWFERMLALYPRIVKDSTRTWNGP
ncbi:MAG: glutathione S-transferase N-terminal domain-containing protein [Rhodospirillaceae bacterium]